MIRIVAPYYPKPLTPPPIWVDNLKHSSDPKERAEFLRSCYNPKNWELLFDYIYDSLANKDDYKFDWVAYVEGYFYEPNVRKLASPLEVFDTFRKDHPEIEAMFYSQEQELQQKKEETIAEIKKAIDEGAIKPNQLGLYKRNIDKATVEELARTRREVRELRARLTIKEAEAKKEITPPRYKRDEIVKHRVVGRVKIENMEYKDGVWVYTVGANGKLWEARELELLPIIGLPAKYAVGDWVELKLGRVVQITKVSWDEAANKWVYEY